MRIGPSSSIDRASIRTVARSDVQRDRARGANHESRYLARRAFGTRRFLLPTALCRDTEARERLYVGAHKAVTERRNGGLARHRVDPLSSLASLRDDLIIGRRTSTVERSIERWRPTGARGESRSGGGGGSGLYPGGKSPRRNQHDRGERPTRRIRTMLPESFRITFVDRRFRSRRSAPTTT